MPPQHLASAISARKKATPILLKASADSLDINCTVVHQKSPQLFYYVTTSARYSSKDVKMSELSTKESPTTDRSPRLIIWIVMCIVFRFSVRSEILSGCECSKRALSKKTLQVLECFFRTRETSSVVRNRSFCETSRPVPYGRLGR